MNKKENNVKKKTIKRWIEDHEYYHNGYHKLSGVNVCATKINYDEDDVEAGKIKVTATIEVDFYNDNRSEKFGNCEYIIPIEELRNI